MEEQFNLPEVFAQWKMAKQLQVFWTQTVFVKQKISF